MSTPSTISIPLSPTTVLSAITTSPTSFPPSPLPTIIFLHYWGGSASTFSLLTPYLSRTYPTLSLSFRGWGSSTGPSDLSAYSIATLASDIISAISYLNLQNYVLVGLSMGAKVAMVVAGRVCSAQIQTQKNTQQSDFGSALRGIILLSPAPPTSLVLPEPMRAQQIHAYDTLSSATFVARSVLTTSFAFQYSDPASSALLPEFLVSDMLRGSVAAQKAWPEYAMGEDVSGWLERISRPVLVVAAEKDVVEPVERVRKEVWEKLPGAEWGVVRDAGHLSVVDEPEVVAEMILRFVDGIEKRN